MAEGEVQQAINVLTEGIDKLVDLNLGTVANELQAALQALKDALDDGGATSEQDEVEDEDEA